MTDAVVSERVELGQVEVPTGTLMILDPGLGRFWRHDGAPVSPRRDDPAHVDLEIVGPDAEAAARVFVDSDDLLASIATPRHIFDVPVELADEVRQRVLRVADGLQVSVDPTTPRLSHVDRARLTVEHAGAGVVTYNGFWAVAVGGLPTDRPLSVVGTPTPDRRWRWVDVVVDDEAEVASVDEYEGVVVEHGQLLCVDLDALGQFRMWESLDGLADYVFWGADAAALAERLGAATVDDQTYGWIDVPVADIRDRARTTQRLIEDDRLRVSVDYRPHDNLEKLNAQIRPGPPRAGTLTLGGALACGFDNRWGDGVFTVRVERNAASAPVRVRIRTEGELPDSG